MICGAVAISFAEAPESEQASWRRAVDRECSRYGLDAERVALTLQGKDPLAREKPKRHWWELLVVGGAVGVFIWLGSGAERQSIAMNTGWMYALIAASVALLAASGWMLWKRTGFS